MEQKVFSMMSKEFTKNYDFYKDYDETEQIFKINFINDMVHLVSVSNQIVIEKIKGLVSLRKNLKGKDSK